jgi:homoserine kinase
VSWAQSPAVVRVPATSANLGPGFDAFGLALGLYDEVEARVTGSGLAVAVRGEGEWTAGAGEGHLVVRAMRAAFARMGGQPGGLALRCTNAIPHGRGLGSSAAAVVSGILAARALVADGGDRLPAAEVLRLAVEFEGHPDNVAACLVGGLTVAWQPGSAGGNEAGANGAGGGGAVAGLVPTAGVVPPEGERGPAAGLPAAGAPGTGVAGGRPVRVLRLDVLASITAVICVAPTAMATQEARLALPASVPHADAAANAARSALLLAALTSDPAVLFDATEDYLHQSYRAAAQPATADLLARLRRAGIAAVVSGAGPSILALGLAGEPPGVAGGPPGVAGEPSGVAGERAGFAGERPGAAGGLPGLAAVDSIARETGIAWHVTPLKVDRQGATVQPGGTGAPRPGAARHGRSTNQAPDPGVLPAGGSTQGRATNPATHGPQSRECRGLLWC